jgi:hypothetical protein
LLNDERVEAMLTVNEHIEPSSGPLYSGRKGEIQNRR